MFYTHRQHENVYSSFNGKPYRPRPPPSIRPPDHLILNIPNQFLYITMVDLIWVGGGNNEVCLSSTSGSGATGGALASVEPVYPCCPVSGEIMSIICPKLTLKSSLVSILGSPYLGNYHVPLQACMSSCPSISP